MPKRVRYLMIGLFFSVLTVMAIGMFVKGEKGQRTLAFIILFGGLAALFLKNAIISKD